jgi:hypothetical protein
MELEGALLTSRGTSLSSILSQMNPVHILATLTFAMNLITTSYKRQGLQKGSLRLCLPAKCYTHLSFSYISYMSSFSLHHLATLMICDEKLRSSFLTQSSPASWHLVSRSLSNPFSDPLTLCSTLTLRDTLLHTYKPTGKFIILFIYSSHIDSRLERELCGCKYFQNFICSSFLRELNFDVEYCILRCCIVWWKFTDVSEDRTASNKVCLLGILFEPPYGGSAFLQKV